MKNPEHKENYIGWKNSWHKWIVLAAGIIQVIGFFTDVNEYRELSNTGIFSDTAWETYSMLSREKLSIKLLSAVCLLIVFIMVSFIKDKTTLNRAEVAALIVILIVWIVIGICFQLISYDHSQIIFGAFCLLIGGAIIYKLFKKKK